MCCERWERADAEQTNVHPACRLDASRETGPLIEARRNSVADVLFSSCVCAAQIKLVRFFFGVCVAAFGSSAVPADRIDVSLFNPIFSLTNATGVGCVMLLLLPNLDYDSALVFTSPLQTGPFVKFSGDSAMVLRRTVDCAVDCFAWDDNSW